MCGCEPGYLCPRCVATPDDPRYVADEPREPVPVYAETERDDA